MQEGLRVPAAALLILVLAAPAAPSSAAEPADAGVLEGKVVTAAGPVPGAVVIVRSLADAAEHASDPTADDGAYRLGGLHAGRYEVAVRTDKGLYLGARSLHLTGAAGQSYSFRIEDRPAGALLADAGQEGEENGEDEPEKPPRKPGSGGAPSLGWDNPLAVVAAGLVFVIGTDALIQAIDEDDDDEDSDGSPSGR